MKQQQQQQLSPGSRQVVFTVKGLCRMCYTCVRECPAKAIRIKNGQAEVIHERCIGCGKCTQVCSQKAKIYLKATDRVQHLLDANEPVAAILDSSFPAEFDTIDYRLLVGMMRSLGFQKVTEMGFGADLVGEYYQKRLKQAKHSGESFIFANCPAVNHYIRHYHPDLVDVLAPVAAPAGAMAKVVKEKYGKQMHTVYIGSCIAKKSETKAFDESLTFQELREMFQHKGIESKQAKASEFDPPHGKNGAIFAVSRGMIQAIGVQEAMLEGEVVVAVGRSNFQEALKEYDSGLLRKNLYLLCCDGCIMGPGMSTKGRKFAKRVKVSDYVQQRLKNHDHQQWEKDMQDFRDFDLSRSFHPQDRRREAPSKAKIQQVLQSMGKFSPDDYLDCKACGYDSCVEHAIAIAHGLAEEEMCLPHTIEQMHQSISQLKISNEKLASVQQALKQTEKLATMGQLSAGIAHELNNPLGVVIMYSNILLEEVAADSSKKEDLKMIVEQADRCKKIVSGLLNFARKNQVKMRETEVRKLIDQALDALIVPENIKIEISDKLNNPFAMLDAEQMTQALSNLAKNAMEAMPRGGKLTISLKDKPKQLLISVKDTGSGIPDEIKGKIFEPFFTTKGLGKGTGLGLATTYGIVKMHKGKINLTSNNDLEKGATGTEFEIEIPRKEA